MHPPYRYITPRMIRQRANATTPNASRGCRIHGKRLQEKPYRQSSSTMMPPLPCVYHRSAPRSFYSEIAYEYTIRHSMQLSYTTIQKYHTVCEHTPRRNLIRRPLSGAECWASSSTSTPGKKVNRFVLSVCYLWSAVSAD